jgi:hypothetical protein
MVKTNYWVRSRCLTEIEEIKNKQKLPTFFLGKVLTVLGRSKVHDHYAQREQLLGLSKAIKAGDAKDFVSKKKFPKDFLQQGQKSEKSA